ncbi:MAG: DUF4177 domain-containing protein [Leucobacter sp.]
MSPGARVESRGPTVHEYAFVSISVKRHREGAVPETDYRDVIHERAADGWVFVQAILLESHVPPRLDLVFTRKKAR